MRRIAFGVAFTATLLVAQALTGAGVSQAAPPNGCPYPPNRPILSARASNSTPARLEAFRIGGYHTQNSCGIGGRKVGLFAREGGAGRFTYLNQTTTGPLGQYGFDYRTDESLEFLVIFSGDRQFPRAVSPLVRVNVR